MLAGRVHAEAAAVELEVVEPELGEVEDPDVLEELPEPDDSPDLAALPDSLEPPEEPEEPEEPDLPAEPFARLSVR